VEDSFVEAEKGEGSGVLKGFTGIKLLRLQVKSIALGTLHIFLFGLSKSQFTFRILNFHLIN
jgi:hypothetical protein